MPEKGLWPADPRDRLHIREAEATGTPFLVLRDDAGAQRIVALVDDRDAAAVIGRSPESDVPIEWDDRVSRTHAQLARVGRRWYVEDEGLSRNGTFVNEQRVHGRSGLQDGDVIRVGHTTIVFRTPPAATGASLATVPESRLAEPPPLSAGQRRALEALCRPCLAPGGPHPPASNEQIAAELHLSIDAVKAHLRQLFRRFDIEELPQIQKRTALVRIAIETGILRSAG
jgi:pSer/pThr/pTyr-binding forkhead associated (FHA) protein